MQRKNILNIFILKISLHTDSPPACVQEKLSRESEQEVIFESSEFPFVKFILVGIYFR